MHHGTAPLLLITVVAAALLAGCSTLTGAAPIATQEVTPQVSGGVRTDCGQISGTAFRSLEERQWYQDNCSQWPLVKVSQSGPELAVLEPAECASMRGKPYQSDAQRQFYLSNCLGSANNAAAIGLAPPPVFAAGPDRSNCDEIWGTPYRSDAERSWFLANCPAVGAPPNAVLAGGPDRTDCNAIRGTAYQSPNERAWFLANCPANGPSAADAGPDRTDCNAIAGSAYRSPAERDWFLANCRSVQFQPLPVQSLPLQVQPVVPAAPDRKECKATRGQPNCR